MQIAEEKNSPQSVLMRACLVGIERNSRARVASFLRYNVPMNAVIFGTNSHEVTDLIVRTGFSIVSENPEVVFCYGGDGTILRAEYAFPGVPKVALRDSRVCKLCSPFTNEEVVKRVCAGSYKEEKVWKLEARVGEKTLYGVNDIVIHNNDPRHAMRYTLAIDGVHTGGEEIIGDGVVLATPFGSTGYYRSIADSFFEVGIGLAFNNSTEQADHMVVREDREIALRVVRGPAMVYADNQEGYIELGVGDEVRIVKSKKFATIVRVQE